MPSSVLLVFFLLVFLIAVLHLLQKWMKRKGSNLPPGFTAWSVITDYLALVKACRSTHRGDFIQHRISRYGKLFTINLAGQPAMVFADAELNRFVLQNEMRLFENAWPKAFRDIMGETNIAFQGGDAHKELRSIIVGFFGTARLRTASFQQNVNQTAKLIFSSWKNGCVVSALSAAKQFAFNVVVQSALSMEAGEPETEKLRESVAILSARVLMLPINLPGTHYHKCMKARSQILNVIKHIMEKRTIEEEKTGRAVDDLLGWVTKNTNLSPEQTGDLLLGLVFAGSDTMSISLALMVYFLEGSPEAIKKLREEHLQVVQSRKQDGKNKLSWEEYKQLEFTQCVIKETLRLGNAARFLVKKASTDMEVRGYAIPRGCKVITHFSAVHLDPTVFDKPEHFNPWRWMGSSGVEKSSFMAFGAGPRLCPGAELAKWEMAVFVHHLQLNYDWKVTEQDPPIACPTIRFFKGLPLKVHSVS